MKDKTMIFGAVILGGLVLLAYSNSRKTTPTNESELMSNASGLSSLTGVADRCAKIKHRIEQGLVVGIQDATFYSQFCGKGNVRTSLRTR